MWFLTAPGYIVVSLLFAALLLGIADVMGKYYVPKLGAFIVYVLMIAILLWRPQGLYPVTNR